jgi:hypothetical protein
LVNYWSVVLRVALKYFFSDVCGFLNHLFFNFEISFTVIDLKTFTIAENILGMIVFVLSSSYVSSLSGIEVEVGDISVESWIVRISSIIDGESSRVVMVDIVIGK